MDLVVRMRTGTAAGTAHQSDGFPSLDFVAPFLQQFVIVPVAGFHPMSVINHNHIAQQPFFTGKDNNTVGSGQNRRSLTRGDIKSFVEFTPIGKWRFAVSKPEKYILN